MNDQLKKPNTYTSEFRESSIKLALESDQPNAQTARDLGVNLIQFIPGSINIQNRKRLLQERMSIFMMRTNA